MANKKAAESYIRYSKSRNEINKSRRSSVKTCAKKVEESIKSGSKEAAMIALKNFEKLGMMSVSKGTFHINTISRKISRFYARIKSITTASV